MAFGIPLALFAEQIVGLVYPDSYRAFAVLVPFLATSYCLSLVGMTIGLAFRSSEMPQAGVVARLIALPPSLLASVPLIYGFGALGAVMGLLLVQVISMSVYGVFLTRGYLSEKQVIGRISQLKSDKNEINDKH